MRLQIFKKGYALYLMVILAGVTPWSRALGASEGGESHGGGKAALEFEAVGRWVAHELQKVSDFEFGMSSQQLLDVISKTKVEGKEAVGVDEQFFKIGEEVKDVIGIPSEHRIWINLSRWKHYSPTEPGIGGLVFHEYAVQLGIEHNNDYRYSSAWLAQEFGISDFQRYWKKRTDIDYLKQAEANLSLASASLEQAQSDLGQIGKITKNIRIETENFQSFLSRHNAHVDSLHAEKESKDAEFRRERDEILQNIDRLKKDLFKRLDLPEARSPSETQSAIDSWVQASQQRYAQFKAERDRLLAGRVIPTETDSVIDMGSPSYKAHLKSKKKKKLGTKQ